ncbi:MAG TPA: DUF2946 family protein [Rhizomicrobium sp.]|nr:DUF2946 family protein [Rhizomicrobium sp.]
MTVAAPQSWRPLGRLVLIVCATLALFLQSYAVQTHFHARSMVSMQAASQTGKHHAPAGDDSDNCPLCHSFYSGQYVAPSLASWFLPLLAVSIIDTATGASPHYDAVSHSWRGRGPPRI